MLKILSSFIFLVASFTGKAADPFARIGFRNGGRHGFEVVAPVGGIKIGDFATVIAMENNVYESRVQVYIENRKDVPVQIDFTYVRSDRFPYEDPDSEQGTGSFQLGPNETRMVNIAKIYGFAEATGPIKPVKSVTFTAKLAAEKVEEKQPAQPRMQGTVMATDGSWKTPDTVPAGQEQVIVDRKGFVAETIQDPEYRAQVEAESRAALEEWARQERENDDEFKKVHDQRLKEWRDDLPSGESNFDNHPDVLSIEAITGKKGVLISPDEARRNDNALVDRGWFPYAKFGDYKYYRSDRERYQKAIPNPFLPGVSNVPSYREIREHFLEEKIPVAPPETVKP